MSQLDTISTDAWEDPPPGTRHLNRLPLLELADGTSVSLPVMLINGADDGPTVYIGGGVHGDEVGATAIVQRVIREIDPAQLRGRLICVPVQNPLAFQVHHRLGLQLVQKSPMDQFPGDPWLDFPGDRDGNGAESIAAVLFALMSGADVAVDVHTPTTGGRYVPFIFVPPEGAGAGVERSGELARACRPDFILDTTAGVYVEDGRPHVELARRGIPAFGFEVGEGGRAEAADTARGWQGVRNLLRYLEMVDEPPDTEPTPRVVRSMTPVRATRGGLLTPVARLGAELGAGDLIATVSSPVGEVVEEIVSPHEGPLMRLTTFAAVAGSDRVASIGVEVR